MSTLNQSTLELVTRVASLYFLEHKTQQEIAKTLGLSRPKVWRLLKTAQETGIVEITVHVPPALSAPLEETLRARFGLSRVIVVPEQSDDDVVRQSVGRAAAGVVDELVSADTRVAVGMGRNVKAVSEAATRLRARPCTCVSAIGGSAQVGGGVNSSEIASALAAALGGEAEGIYAPAYAENKQTRDAFLRHTDISRTLAHAREADIALVGIGDADDESLVVRLGCISVDEMRRMRESGAVGDILGNFFNQAGDPVAEWIEERVVGIGRRDISNIPVVIATTSERSKAEAVIGALRSGMVNVLVTSIDTARRIADLSD